MEVLFFCNKLNKIVNKHGMHLWKRCHTAKQSNFQNPTKGVRTSIKVKNRFYLSGDDAKYKLYRNKICSLKCKKQLLFFFEYFNTNSNNMKKTWKGIKDLLNRWNKKSKLITQLSVSRPEYLVFSMTTLQQ